MCSNSISIKVGKSNNKGAANLALNHPQSDNGHILISGKPGSGKTVGSSKIAEVFLKNGISVFTVDQTDGLRLDKIPQPFLKKHKDQINVVPVYDVGLGMNLLEHKEICVNGQIRKEKDCDLADRITDLMTETHRLGQGQQCLLSNAITEALSCNCLSDGVELEDVCEILEDKKDQSARSLHMKLQRISRRNIFTSGNFSWEKVLYGEPTLTIFQLSGLQSEIKRLVSDFIFMYFMYYLMLHGDMNKPCVLWADECQTLNFKKDSPLYDILTLGRKFGVSAMFCSQFLHGNFKPEVEKALSTAATRLIFRPTDAECKYLANLYGIKDENELLSLKKLECIAYGKFVDAYGNVMAQSRQRLQFKYE